MQALGGTLSIIILILGLFLAILALLMPWFVYQIRNQTKSMDQKMDTIIGLLGGQKTTSNKLVKICPFCGTKNRAFDHVCMNCGKAMGI